MRIRSICRVGRIALSGICLGLSLSGCGNILYTYSANGASTKLEEARQAGAEKTALYEYTLAQEHLKKAMSEASEADYGDAYELAQLAEGFADQAIEKAKRRMRARGNDKPATDGDTQGSETDNASPPQPERKSDSDGAGEQK
jgi:hypothetical protein